MAEYPELAAEVEEEIKKLEAEQQSRQAEVEMLQHELEQTEKAAAESRKSSSGSAFVPSPETGNDSNAPVEDDFEIIHDGDSTGDEETDSKLLEEQEIIPNEVVEKLVSEGAKEESTEIIPKNETTSEEDFTMQALTFEIIRAMVKQVESDVRRIIELMTPVIRPILRAGDVAWRHLRVTFESLRHSYENSRPTNETNVDGLKDKALV